MKPNYTQNAIPTKLDLFFIITGPRLVKYAILFYLTSSVYTTFDDNSVRDINRFGGNDEKVVVQNRQLFWTSELFEDVSKIIRKVCLYSHYTRAQVDNNDDTRFRYHVTYTHIHKYKALSMYNRKLYDSKDRF